MRQPDRKAPRFRTAAKSYNSFIFINKFKEKYPQYSHYPNEVLLKLIVRHCEAITEAVANTREGIELQSGVGMLFAAMVPCAKGTHKMIAWDKSTAMGMKVHYNNNATDGRLVKIVYGNYHSKFKFENRHLWKFIACRDFKLLVSDRSKEMHTRYIHKDNHIKLWAEFYESQRKDYAIKSQSQSLKTYNEFDLS